MPRPGQPDAVAVDVDVDVAVAVDVVVAASAAAAAAAGGGVDAGDEEGRTPPIAVHPGRQLRLLSMVLHPERRTWIHGDLQLLTLTRACSVP